MDAAQAQSAWRFGSLQLFLNTVKKKSALAKAVKAAFAGSDQWFWQPPPG